MNEILHRSDKSIIDWKLLYKNFVRLILRFNFVLKILFQIFLEYISWRKQKKCNQIIPSFIMLAGKTNDEESVPPQKKGRMANPPIETDEMPVDAQMLEREINDFDRITDEIMVIINLFLFDFISKTCQC